jgi:hypothetical protein
MTSAIRSAFLAVILLALALAGCGGTATRPAAPSSVLERVGGSSAGRIVLTASGAQRIGIRTARVLSVTASAPQPSRAGGPTAVIPFSAVVYDPNGRTYAFSSPAPLTFTEVPIDIDHVSGDSAYLLKGPRPGTQVVTVGAEELFGVQTGVMAQT